jgi:hypothetical protein
MIAAASGLIAATISVATRTAVVIQAANLGPRTSTLPGWVVVVLLDTVLLLDSQGALLLQRERRKASRRRVFRGCSERCAGRARLLSSYSNSNNNSLRCGTDRLRDAG